MKKKTKQENKPAKESVKPDQIMPFEDAVRRLLQTPPLKKPKFKDKKDSA